MRGTGAVTAEHSSVARPGAVVSALVIIGALILSLLPLPVVAAQTLDANGSVVITTVALPDGSIGRDYAARLASYGGEFPLAWSVADGNLPSGLAMSSGGDITGAPLAAGLSRFTVEVVDNKGVTARQDLAILIADAPGITTTNLPSGQLEVDYSTQLAAAGGVEPYRWSIVSGALPAGLTMSLSGAVTGTPQATGTATVGVQVTDANGATATRELQININDALTRSQTIEVLAPATVGSSYSTTLSSSGGTPPYTWTVMPGSTLPGGLGLDAATGTLSGTPTTAGSFAFAVEVTDDNDATQSLDLVLDVAAAVVITTSVLASGQVGIAYSASLTATGGNAPLSWTVASGSLPVGLTLAADGAITGTPTSAGVGNVTFKVTDAVGAEATKALSITIAASVTITTTSLPDGQVGLSYSQGLQVTGGRNPYSWSLDAGSLPAGLSLASNGNITGTPTTVGSSTFTVRVTDRNDDSTTRTFTVAIVPAPEITTSTLVQGAVNISYVQNLAVTGGVAPYTWSLANGSLPTGLILGSSTGNITGTPSAAGTFNFTARVSDAYGGIATKALTITIQPPVSVATTTLPPATQFQSYTATVTASGGLAPYTWTLTGSLPAGLNFDASTGTISGTPTATGSLTFTVEVTDSTFATASRSLTILVSAPPQVTTNSLAGGQVGKPYSATLAASGGSSPLSWSLASGALPAGLSLGSSTGVISGTPTAAAAGTTAFTVRVTDGAGAIATASLSLTFLDITTASLPGGGINRPYSATVSVTGGTGPYTWSLSSGSLPVGVSLDAATGAITGTPTATGTSTFTLSVTDTGTSLVATATYSITIVSAPTVTTASLPSPQVGIAYTQSLAVTGGAAPYVWTLASGALPAGLTLAGDGTISGTPSAAGSSTFSARVTDTYGGEATASLTLTVVSRLTVTTSSLPPSTVGAPYAASLAASGGLPPTLWSISLGQLPTGLTLNASTGAISGTPTASGNWAFTAQATDSTGVTATRSLSIIVAAQLFVATSSLPNAQTETAYASQVTSTGGTAPVTWSIASGALPTGLALNTATGAITGTPTTAGTVSFTVRVTDAAGAVATRSLSISVVQGPTFTVSTLPDGSLGRSYSATVSATGKQLRWSVVSGNLPPGLTLSSTKGTITGTATTAGAYAFTIQIKDSNGLINTRAFSVTIFPPPSISTAGLTPAQEGVAFIQTITAAGGAPPLVWSVASGTLPPGLTLATATGVLAGTPTAGGTFTFTVRVTDAYGATGNKSFTMAVSPAPRIDVSALPPATEGRPWTTTFTATGGTAPLTWSRSAGTLPTGLSLTTAGELSGTTVAAGTYTFTLRVTDSQGATSSRDITITVAPPVDIITAAVPNGRTLSSYSATLVRSGGSAPLSWAVTGGSLPPGLALGAATGAITGTPSTVGSFAFAVTVTDAAGSTDVVNLSIEVFEGPLVTTGSLPRAQVDQNYLQTLTALGGLPPYEWSIVSGELPGGMIFSSAGVLEGAPLSAGTVTLGFEVTDSRGLATVRELEFEVVPPPTITTLTLRSGALAVPYSQSLQVAGGTAPYVWDLASDELPSGMSLSASGALTGTPDALGSWTFRIRVTDSLGASDVRRYTVEVVPPVAIESTVAPSATINRAYTTTLISTDGVEPVIWTITSGALPAGLSLGTNTGIIAGTPTASGSFTFTVRATDAAGSTASRTFTIVVAATPSIVTTALTDAQRGLAYEATLAASGGTAPLTWALASGTLPAGLSLATNGTISGTPTVTGTNSFTVRVTDAYGATATRSLSLRVNDGPIVTTTALPGGRISFPYSASLAATGGRTPYTWSLESGALPPGLSLATTGAISGTPSLLGTSTATFRVTDRDGKVNRATLSITIFSGFTIITTSPALGQVDVAYNYPLATANGSNPITWAIIGGTLPSGLSLSGSAITGTPTTSGASSVTIQATDGGGQQTSEVLSFTVVPPPTVSTTALPTGGVGAGYDTTLVASGGLGGYAWSVVSGSLPPGVNLEASGRLRGTPTVGGTFAFTVQVTDGNGKTATQELSIEVSDAPQILTEALPGAAQNQPYSATLVAVGGAPPFAWSRTGGSLPPGLSLTAGGTISGTPTRGGVYPVTLRATDALGRTVSRAYELAVGTLITISNLPPGGASNTDFSKGSCPPAPEGTPYGWHFVLKSNDGAWLSLTATFRDAGVITTFIGAGTKHAYVYTATTDVLLDAYGIISGSSDGFNLSHVCLPPVSPCSASITTSATLRDAYVNEYYREQFEVTGITSGTWSVIGSLPEGLYLNATTGVLEGVPTSVGTFTFEIKVVDSDGCIARKTFTLNVRERPECLSVITPTMLGDAVIGQPYQATLAVSGVNNPTWVLEGTLPPGLTLNTVTGVISGTPTALGTGTFRIAVTPSEFNCPAPVTFAITVTPPPCVLAITTSSLDDAVVGSPYSATLAVQGANPPTTWSTIGTLPPGLTLNTSTGVISGTPTATGTYSFLVTVVDVYGCTDVAPLVIKVNTAPCPPAVVTPSSLSEATLGIPYSATLSVTGLASPVIWSVIGQLPAGLTLGSTTGIISGTPTQTGLFSFVVEATDPQPCSAVVPLSIRVEKPECPTDPAPAISPASLAAATRGVDYSETFTAQNLVATEWVLRGQLPPGLDFDASGATATISGTPTSVGTWSFSLEAIDADGCSAAVDLVLVVEPPVCLPIIITTTGLPTGLINQTYSATVSATGGTFPYTWSLTGTIPGLTLDSVTGVIAGTPTSTGTYGIVVRILDADDCADEVSLTVEINDVPPPCPPPVVSITTEALPSGKLGSPYTASVEASDGVTPYTWAIEGSLPPGISFNVLTGQFSGTPTSAAPVTFLVTVTDDDNCQDTVQFTIDVDELCPPDPAITTSALPGGTVNQPYTATVTATGGTGAYTWAVSEGLPPGISFNPSTQTFSGTPTAEGSATVTVTVTDANGCTDSTPLTIVIDPPPPLCPPDPAITTSALPGGTVNQPYTATVTATGGTGAYTWAVSEGLPPGISFNPSTQTFSGTPTAEGSATITVTVTDANGCTDSTPLTIVIDPPPPACEPGAGVATAGGLAPAQTAFENPSISPTSLPGATRDQPYSVNLTASGGAPPYVWSINGTLPTGVTFNTVTAVLSGTPTVSGSFTAQITVTDDNGCTDSRNLTLVVNPPGCDSAAAITTTTLPTGKVGVAYPSTTLTATGLRTPLTWSSGALPAGLTLSTTGVISGTPTVAGTGTFVVTTLDTDGCLASTTLSILVTVCVPAPSISPSSLPAGEVGTAYAATLTASGITGVTWTSGALPAGLTLNASTGTISGTPLEAGTTSFTVQAQGTQDGNVCVASANLSITVDPVTGRVAGVAWFDLNRNLEVDSDEPLLTGIFVTLFDGTTPIGTVQTGPDGTFEFLNLEPGKTYRVEGFLNDPRLTSYGPDANPIGWAGTVVAAPSNQIPQFGDNSFAPFPAVADGNLRGRVIRRSTGAPVPGAAVECFWEGLDSTFGTGDDARFDRISNADGRFELLGIPFGDYRCSTFDPVDNRAVVDSDDVALGKDGEVLLPLADPVTTIPTTAPPTTAPPATAPPRPVSVETVAKLPATGAQIAGLALVAGGLLLTGGLFAGIGRRRKRES
jgi:large repetitive protein